MAEEEAALAEVMNLLQTEPEPSSGPAGGGLVPTAGPDIPALREQLAVLVSTGKAKEAIEVQLTHEQVKHLSNKDVEKFTKCYETYVGSKTTESLMDSFIFLITKVVGMVVNIKDIDAYQKELRNDYIINKELSNLAGNLALKCRQFLAAANAALITTNILILVHSCQSRAPFLVMNTDIRLRALMKYPAQQLQNDWSPIINNC